MPKKKKKGLLADDKARIGYQEGADVTENDTEEEDLKTEVLANEELAVLNTELLRLYKALENTHGTTNVLETQTRIDELL